MRGSVLMRVATVGCLIVALAEPAAAQRPQSSPQYPVPVTPQYQQRAAPQPFSVDGQLQRYSRQRSMPDPVRDRELAERERLRRLGLPYYDPDAAKTMKTGPSGAVTPHTAPGGVGLTAAPTLSDLDRNYSRYDGNRDGAISRGEYLNSRARVTPPAVRNTFRERTFRERADSRFRANDRNSDGRVTPDELQDMRNPRF